MASDFYEAIYELVRQIPKGKVCTYGRIAAALEKAGAARQVGYALNKCPTDVPAHRVVNRLGRLTGKLHFGGQTMQALLEAEGLEIVEDQIQNFEQYIWEPLEEL
ncbi:MGMT family protein [Saprospira grandis]|uniref:MGMT family protein n=1 Tax=Saprospira grandis TaxID=1008 RepID=UPI0022DD9CC4|nr:MGMT family protein [Saprospira grandis]WBM73763.1 MGMT family protein [Saprospira grandis]